MTTPNPTGRAPSLSMADFNERAKRIAEKTGAVEKGDHRRAPPSRFRRDVRGGIAAAPKKEEPAG